MSFPLQNMFRVKNFAKAFVIQDGLHFTASGHGGVNSNTIEFNMGYHRYGCHKQLIQWIDMIRNEGLKEIKAGGQ